MPYFIKSKPRGINVSIGVYLTDKSICILQLEWVDNSFYVSNFQRFFLPNNLKYNKFICRKIKDAKFKSSRVAIAIADSSTLRKSIKVSKKLSASELDEIARIEAQKHILAHIDNVCFDYILINDKDQQSDFYEMLIIAAKSNLILTKMKRLSALGLHVDFVDVESNCILRVVEILIDRNRLPVTFAWIEIGDNKIKIFVIKSRKIIFLHEDSYLHQSVIGLSGVLAKIERALLYYDATNHNDLLELVYLSGAYPKLDNLRCLLSKNKQLPVTIPDFFKLNKFFATDIKFPFNKLVMTLGMALAK